MSLALRVSLCVASRSRLLQAGSRHHKTKAKISIATMAIIRDHWRTFLIVSFIAPTLAKRCVGIRLYFGAPSPATAYHNLSTSTIPRYDTPYTHLSYL